MSHFKYEIDERNIRRQLKALEMPLNEDAWQKFESYSSGINLAAASNSASRFKFSLNRNVMLPAVFGCVIILFSLLLFNFVNIKNPNPVREERAQSIQKPAAPQQQPANDKKNQQQTPVKELETPAAVMAENNDPAPLQVASEEEHTALTDKTQEHKILVTPARDIAADAPAGIPEKTAAKTEIKAHDNSATVTTEPRPKKSSKKRSVVVIEPAEGEDEQAPPPVSEATAE